MRAEQYIDDLAASGRHHFTTTAAFEAIGGSDDAVRAHLRRLKQQGRVASPMRTVSCRKAEDACRPAAMFEAPWFGGYQMHSGRAKMQDAVTSSYLAHVFVFVVIAVLSGPNPFVRAQHIRPRSSRTNARR